MNNKSNFTQIFIRVTPDSPPTVEMLKELPLPKGRTFTVERREVRGNRLSQNYKQEGAGC